LGLAPERCYKSFEEMADAEAKRDDKIDFAVIVAPNYVHYAAVKAFLSRGIHVVCEKPLTFEPEEAQELADLAKRNKLLLGVTYTYTGYPTVKHIREMIRRGEIGDVRFVMGEYPQEWLATPLEKTDPDQRQAKWRTDPKIAGKSNCVGDIGSHIENTVSYMTGLKIKSLCARLDKTLEGRVLDDNASIMLEFESPTPGGAGAKGMYWSSQIAVGYDNALVVRIFGSKGTIEWRQEACNYFEFIKIGEPRQHWSRGRDGFYPHAQSFSRIPSGHPEGYFEALANIYKTYIAALHKLRAGEPLSEADMDFPGAEMGIDGVKFISKCVESSNKGAVWVNF
jgi:predicted dehydrogenase